MQKIISQQGNIYKFDKQIKTLNSKKYIEKQSQSSEPKTKILNSLKLKKKDNQKTSNNPILESKNIQENGREIINSLSKPRKFNKYIRSSQHSEENLNKIMNDFKAKSIKDLVSSDQKLIKNLLQVQFDSKLINTEKKSNEELKNIIENLQVNHFKQIKMLENIIYQVISNGKSQNQQSLYFKSNNSQKAGQQIIGIKNQLCILKKRYIETIDSNIKLIQKFNDLENKFKNQVDQLEMEIKKLNKIISEFPQNLNKERSIIQSIKKYTTDINQQKSPKKVNLGHIFTFKKYDLSQKVLKSKIIQTFPQNQISYLKSNVNGTPQQETYYQYYNHQSKQKIIKTEKSSGSSMRIRFKNKRSFQNQIDDGIKKSTIDEHHTQSSQDFSELELESVVQSKFEPYPN